MPGHKYRPGRRGRPPVDDRAALTGIVFVLRSGIPWDMPPLEAGRGSGVTCWRRRLRHWRRRGVWKKLLAAMLQEVQAGPGIDLSKVVPDGRSVRAVFGGALTGKNPTGRAKQGGKRHLLVGRKGTPPAVRITGANRHDSTRAMALIDAVPPIQGRRGRPRRRPGDAYGDRAYGTPANRRGLRLRRIKGHSARPRTPHGSGLGRVRQVVERAPAWVGHARRLKIRYEKPPAPHRALHYLRMARMCCRIIERDF